MAADAAATEPLLGLARDFHPLDNAHAERTKKSPGLFSSGLRGRLPTLPLSQYHRRGEA